MNDLIFGDRAGYVYCCYGSGNGQLQAITKLQANNTDLKVTNNSAPELVDWNGDGLFDILLASDENGGKVDIKLYLNTGSKQQYKFTTSSQIMVGSTPIKLSRAQIQVVDLTKDGKFDLVIGDGDLSGCKINILENVGTKSAPKFDKIVHLQKGDGTVFSNQGDVHLCVADWDNNGTPDILWSGYPDKTDQTKQVFVLLNDSPTDAHVSVNSLTMRTINLGYHNNTVLFQYNARNLHDVSASLFTSGGKLIKYIPNIINSNGVYALDMRYLSQGLYFVMCKNNNNAITNFVITNYKQ